MIGGGLMLFKWECLYLLNWENWLENKNILIKCGICMNIFVINMVRMVCIIKKKVCGGEIKILIFFIKNLMVRIVIGVVVMDGYM